MSATPLPYKSIPFGTAKINGFGGVSVQFSPLNKIFFAQNIKDPKAPARTAKFNISQSQEFVSQVLTDVDSIVNTIDSDVDSDVVDVANKFKLNVQSSESWKLFPTDERNELTQKIERICASQKNESILYWEQNKLSSYTRTEGLDCANLKEVCSTLNELKNGNTMAFDILIQELQNAPGTPFITTIDKYASTCTNEAALALPKDLSETKNDTQRIGLVIAFFFTLLLIRLKHNATARRPHYTQKNLADAKSIAKMRESGSTSSTTAANHNFEKIIQNISVPLSPADIVYLKAAKLYMLAWNAGQA